MKITMELVWDAISQTMPAQYFGPKSDAGLKRPELFSPKRPLSPHRVYVAAADTLPTTPAFTREMLLVCAGGRPAWAYMRGNFPFIWVEGGNLLDVFNEVQEIFDRYETWCASLTQIVDSDADVAEMVRRSLPILGNPICVVDSTLHYLAQTVCTDGGGLGPVHVPSDPMPLEQVKQIRPQYYADQKRTEPYRHGDDQYCVNLFVNGHFEGSITVLSCVRPFRPSDLLLLRQLGYAVEAAVQKHAKILTAQSATLKSVVFDLLNCCPVSDYRIQQLLQKKGDGSDCQFLCFKLKLAESVKKLPTDYICDTLEGLLPGCVCMEYESIIAGILDFSVFPHSYHVFTQMLELYLREMGFQAGLSDEFSDIRTVRYYFRQACCAIETGVEIDEGHLIYRFRDYALPYMLLHSTGEFPASYLCPRGLLKLRAYDGDSAVDYWGTLRTYLNNGLNAAQTAKDLYLHRSTLLQRLERIYDILDMDVREPGSQLWLRMAIWLLDAEEVHRDPS